MGFWSHEFALTTVFYRKKNKKTAFLLNTTYEINGKKRSLDVRPGSNLCLEYAISQIFKQRYEIDLTGYSLWQLTKDKGSDATHTDRDYVHAIGFQLTYWPIENKFSISSRYLKEYLAKDRFLGNLLLINFSYSF